MADASLEAVVRHLRQIVPPPADPRDDRELLAAFAARHDQAAFAVLVRRHGTMVLNVCRRVLHHEQDAEDTFQATFLVLAAKAQSLRLKTTLAGFLHGVAYHLALKARRETVRRQRREARAQVPACVDAATELSWREVQAVLEEEIQRLPTKYRMPFVLCCLEGMGRAEAGRQLGLKEGTVWSRLSQARARLRERLTRRGIALSAALGVMAVSDKTLRAGLVETLIQAAKSGAVGSMAGAASARVALLTQVGLRTMTGKMKLALVGLVALLAVGAGGTVFQALTAKPPETPASTTPRAEAAAESSKVETPQVHRDRYGDPLPAGAVTRLGTLRFRHEGEAWSLAFSPDDKILASTSADGLIHMWDAATGRELRRIHTTEAKREYLSHVFALAFSPDGKVLASRGTDDAVCLWDAATGEERRRIAINNASYKLDGPLCFSPDGKILAIDLLVLDPPREPKPRVSLLDVATGKELRHFDFPNGVGAHGFSPDGKILAVTTMTIPEVQLWDVATGKPIRRVKGEWFYRLAFSPDGKLLASAGKDRILLTDVKSGEEVGRLEAKMDVTMSLAFTPDGKTLLSGNQDGKVRFWDVASKKPRRQLDAHLRMIRDLALSHDGKTVAVGTVQNTIRLWDVVTGKELFEQYQGPDAQVNAVAFSPDGTVLASGGDNQQIRLWNPVAGNELRQIKSSARTIVFSPDGKRLASLGTSDNDAARLWDVATGKETLRLPHEGVNTAKGNTLHGLAFSPDGQTVLTVDHPHFKQGKPLGSARLHVWDAATGRHVRDFPIPEMFPESLAAAPDGKLAALGGNQALQVRHLESGELIRSFPGHPSYVVALAFSPDGRTLASGGGLDRTVHLWEMATGKPIRTLHGHTLSMSAVAFAPGGRFLASGSAAPQYPRNGLGPHKIRLWDVLMGKEVFHFQGHDSNVTSLAFTADGSRLASGLRNSSVLIWDVSPLSRSPSAATKPIAAEELAHLWADLAAEDAACAYEAIGRLVSAPKQAVALLKSRLKPATATDEKQVRQRIADLDSEQFVVREAASRELERLGDEAEPALRRALANHPSLEMRRRLEPLLASLHTLRSPEAIRPIRAVQALEYIGTADAREVLAKLAKGAPKARQTREVEAALRRLTR